MANVEVTKDNAAEIAAKYGVRWGVNDQGKTTRGRKPITKLYAAMVAAGDTPTGDYVRDSSRVEPVGPGAREYDVTRKFLVERKTSKGVRKMPSKETVRVNVKDLRDVLGYHARGKLGASRIQEAIVKLRDAGTSFVGWTDADVTDATVALVIPKQPSAKAAEKAPTPRNSKAKGSARKSSAKAATAKVEPVTEQPAEQPVSA